LFILNFSHHLVEICDSTLHLLTGLSMWIAVTKIPHQLVFDFCLTILYSNYWLLLGI